MGRVQRAACLAPLVVLVAAIVGLLGFGCGGSDDFKVWRPPDATLLGSASYDGGELGGGGTVRAFDTSLPFDRVVDGYAQYVNANGGRALRAGAKGWRFQSQSHCVIVYQWQGRDAKDFVDAHLSSVAIGALDESAHGYVENTPRDCGDFL